MTNRKLKTYLWPPLIALLVFAAIACESEKRDEITLDDLPDPISFSEHILPIFEQKCVQCHAGTTPPNLAAEDAYLDITATGRVNTESPLNSKLYHAIDVGGGMYQYASDLDRAYILKWIDDGALDN